TGGYRLRVGGFLCRGGRATKDRNNLQSGNVFSRCRTRGAAERRHLEKDVQRRSGDREPTRSVAWKAGHCRRDNAARIFVSGECAGLGAADGGRSFRPESEGTPLYHRGEAAARDYRRNGEG